jgi:hypothetical protein
MQFLHNAFSIEFGFCATALPSNAYVKAFYEGLSGLAAFAG